MEASERVSRQRRVMGLSLVGALSRLLYLVVNPHFRPGILSRETRGLFAAPQHQLHKTSHTLRLLVTLITITAAPRGTPRSGCRPPPGCDGGPVPRPPCPRRGWWESFTSVTLHATTTPTAGRYTSGVKSVFSRKRLFTTRYLYGRKKQTPVLQY